MKITKIFIDTEHSYDLHMYSIDGTDVYELYYSAMPLWTYPNQLIYKMVDDGNLNVTITPHPSTTELSFKELVIDVSQITELNILFEAYERKNGNPIYKRFEEVK